MGLAVCSRLIALKFAVMVGAYGALVGSAVAQDARGMADIANNVELHAFESRTLSDSAFLTGDVKAGKAVTITGQFRVAQGKGKRPVVVLMHGSSGIGSNIEMWARHLNAMGVSTFAIDSMTGRGLKSVGANQAALGRLNFVLDIYRSLDILAKHPTVDTSRVALMGFSRGGQAALYASLNRFHKLWNTSGIAFAAYMPFYPACVTHYIDEKDVAKVPISIFHGADDDYNEVAPCKSYIERLSAAGNEAVAHVYAGGQHGFDVPTIAGKTIHAKTSQTARRCKISETAAGVLTNEETKAPFSYKDACVQLGPHVGGNVAATEAARKEVETLVRRVFKL